MIKIAPFRDLSITEARYIVLNLDNQVAKGITPSLRVRINDNNGLNFKALFYKYI